MDNPADQNTIPVPEINNPAPPAADIPLTPPVSPPSPEGIVAPPKKSSKGFPKPLILSLSLLLFVTATALGVYYVQKEGLPFNVNRSAQEWVCGREHGACNGHASTWSTCDGSGRWGCGDCNVTDLPDDWCEGTTHKHCSGGNISVEENDPHCNGSGSGDCTGKSGIGIVCEGQSNNDGSVTALNCTGQTKHLVCQNNHTSFNDVNSCQGIQRYDKDPQYPHQADVAHGSKFTCSVSVEGSCGFAQADVVHNGAGVCWDIKRNCTNCSPSPTNTPTPTPTPTPTQGATPCCSNVTLTKVDAEGKPLEGTDFKIGDRVKIAVTLEGTVENVLIRIKKDGVKIHDEQAGLSKSNGWSYIYEIPSTGEYEVLSFVKVNGIWK